MASRDDFKRANQYAKDLEARIPRAVSAHYDRKTGRIVVHLSSKVIVSFSPTDAEGLEGAQPSQLKEIEISPSGFGLHFPAVDADVQVGSDGRSRSKGKQAASRANGKLGGRPRKSVAR
jgi:hypothetical protein